MAKPPMSSDHGFELNTSINSRARLVASPGTGRGLYMISVITSPIFRLDGPGGSRSRENCAFAEAQAISVSNGRAWNFTKETIFFIMQVPGMTTAIRQGYIRVTLSLSGPRPGACGIAAARAQPGQEKAPAQERRGTFSRYHDPSPNASSAVV